MKSIKDRIKKLENRDGFKSGRERKEYLRAARLIDPDLDPASIKTPADYLRLIREALPPLPSNQN